MAELREASERLKEIRLREVELYFEILARLMELIERIPKIDSKEEKIKAYKTYFLTLGFLRKMEAEIKSTVETL